MHFSDKVRTPCPFRYRIISQRLESARCCLSFTFRLSSPDAIRLSFTFILSLPGAIRLSFSFRLFLFQTVVTRCNKTVVHFQTVIDMETMLPTEKLSPAAVAWCRSVGSSATTLSDVLNQRDEKILKALQGGIDRANARAISRAQKIQKWSVLPHDFSIPGGELGTCGGFLSPSNLDVDSVTWLHNNNKRFYASFVVWNSFVFMQI